MQNLSISVLGEREVFRKKDTLQFLGSEGELVGNSCALMVKQILSQP